MPNRSQNQGKGTGRGFASMDAARQRAIASAGGRAAHRSGHAHEFDAEEAREAGRRGGLARSANRNRAIKLADGQGVIQVRSDDHESVRKRPSRDVGRGQGDMRTAGRHQAEADDASTRLGRGKHH